MQRTATRALQALAVMAGCLIAGASAAASDYPYPGVFTNFARKTYDAFSPTLKEVACYEHLFVQDENGDFTTYVLDGLQWLRDRKIVYLVLSKGHCDFFPHAGIEQCSVEDVSDGKKSEAFSRLGGLGALGVEERIYPSEQALLTDRGVDAIRSSAEASRRSSRFSGRRISGRAHATSLGKRARSATTSRPPRRATTIWSAPSCAGSGM